MKRYKNKIIPEYKIKIEREVEVYGDKTSKEYKGVRIYVDIDRGSSMISFSVPIKGHYGKALRKAFKEIKKYLYL